MIYNTVSTKNVISKILRDLDIQEDNTRFADIIEWIGEGLTKIGAIKSQNVKVTGREDQPLISFTDYQARLPRGLVKVLGVAYSSSESGEFIPLRYGTGVYDHRSEDNEGSSNTIDASTSDLIDLAMELYDLTYEEALELINTDSVTRAKLNSILRVDSTTYSTQDQTNTTYDYTYVINSNYIKMNIKEGYLMMAYTVYPTDEDGYPLIPDDPSFTEALYWYVVTKYWYPLWVQGKVRDTVYFEARSSWNFYRKQAYAHAMLPSIDQMESLKNQVLKIYPEVNDFKNFFTTSGEQQIIY